MAEIRAARELCDRAGLNTEILFGDRGDGYADWRYDTSRDGLETVRNEIRHRVAQRAAASPWPEWWNDQVEPTMQALPEHTSLIGIRNHLVDSFTAQMAVTEMDHFEAAGIAATWWKDSFYELTTASSRGWKAVIEAWLTTAEATQDDKNPPDLANQTAIKLLASPQLASRADLAAALARLEAEIEAAQAHSDRDNELDGDTVGPAEIKQMKSELTRARKQLRNMDSSLLDSSHHALDAMAPDEASAKAIGVVRSRIEKLVDDHYAGMERAILAWYDGLVEKYGTTLTELQATWDAAAVRLEKHLKELGYE